MEHLRIFAIVLLVAVLTVVVAVYACENFEAKVDEAQKKVDALNSEVRAKRIASSLLARLIATLDDKDIIDRLKDDNDNLSAYMLGHHKKVVYFAEKWYNTHQRTPLV